MRVSGIFMAGTLVAGGLLGGCSNLKQQAEMLTEENRALREQLTGRNQELAQMRQEIRDLQTRAAAPPVQQPLAQAAVTGFENIDNVSVSTGTGEVTVEVESDVLFAAGKSSLRATARASLDSVAQVLKRSYAGHPIRVEGHTDSDPIRKSGYKSNHHLGFERAYTVREYLVSRGIEPTRIAVASYGPDRPRGSKSASRRVQIVVQME